MRTFEQTHTKHIPSATNLIPGSLVQYLPNHISTRRLCSFCGDLGSVLYVLDRGYALVLFGRLDYELLPIKDLIVIIKT
jgi:hypothetical protein